jgi:hypothetical protein
MLEQKDAAVVTVAVRRHWREDDARVLLVAWRRSGQTLTAFARVYDIHPERLGRWHRLLRTGLQGAVRFHQVRVRGVERPSDEKPDRIEPLLGSGRLIRVPYGFNADDLRRLLAVAEAGV